MKKQHIFYLLLLPFFGSYFSLNAQTAVESHKGSISLGISLGTNVYRSPQEFSQRSGGQAGGCTSGYEDLNLHNGFFGSARLEIGLGKYVSLAPELGFYKSSRDYTYTNTCFSITDPTPNETPPVPMEASDVNFRIEVPARVFLPIGKNVRTGIDVGPSINLAVRHRSYATSPTRLLVSNDQPGYFGVLGGYFLDVSFGKHQIGGMVRGNWTWTPEGYYGGREFFRSALSGGLTYSFKIK